jgi:hypothetical protein
LTRIELAKKELVRGKYSCVLVQDGEVVMTSFEKGVKPLMRFYESRELYKSPVLADKVIGRAAAFLAVLCGITEVYAEVISEDAIKVLEDYQVPVTFRRMVPYIANRSGDGLCPMEELSKGVETPLEMYEKIQKWLQKIETN